MFHPFELSQLVNNQIVCAYDIDIKIAAECSSEVLTEDKSPSSQVDTTTISLPTTSCTCLRSEVTNMSLSSVDIGKLLATDKQILSKLSREEKYHILTTETDPIPIYCTILTLKVMDQSTSVNFIQSGSNSIRG